MARRPWEPGQATQAKPQHRGPLWKLSTPSCRPRMGVAPVSGAPVSISDAGPGPACQPWSRAELLGLWGLREQRKGLRARGAGPCAGLLWTG